jgi:hypothetical protein
MIGDAVFEEKAGRQVVPIIGCDEGESLHGALTEEQRRPTAFSSKILRTAGL